MNTLNETTVEAAALEWFGAPYFASCGELRRARLGCAVGYVASFAKLRRVKPQLAPGEPAA